ncbi:MAG: alpha-amylase family glycosyl hydrolase, partial [bacterium]|nr:alpha-amylase family glycosyl hydrolase [bacterium]
MRRRIKKVISYILALAMILTSLSFPVNEKVAYAETKEAETVSDVINLTDQLQVKADGSSDGQAMKLYLNGVYEAKVTLKEGTHTLQVLLNGTAYGEEKTVQLASDQDVYVRVKDGTVINSVTDQSSFHTASVAGTFDQFAFKDEKEAAYAIKGWDPKDENGLLDYIGGGLYKRTFQFTALEKDTELEYKVAFDQGWDYNIGDEGNNVKVTLKKGTEQFSVLADEVNGVIYDSIRGSEYTVSQTSGTVSYPALSMSVSLIGTIRYDDAKNWDNKQKGFEFTQVSDTLFLYQAIVKAGSYDYKTVFNYDKWYEKTGDNKKLSVTEDDTNVIFLYDASDESLLDSVNNANDIAVKLGMKEEPAQSSITTNPNGTTTFITTAAKNETDQVQLVYAKKTALNETKTIDFKKGTDSKGNFNGTFQAKEVFFGDEAVDLYYYYKINGKMQLDNVSEQVKAEDGTVYNHYQRDEFKGRDVYVPGTFPGESWNPATNKMEYKGNGLYEYTFKNVGAANYEYKIAMGSWSENYGGDGVSDGSNMAVTVTKTQDVTVYYMDLVTHYSKTSIDYTIADIVLEGTGIPENCKFEDPGLAGIYSCTATLKAGKYSDVKAVFEGKEYKMGEFTLSEEKAVTFYFDPSTDIYYNDSTKVDINASNVHYDSKSTVYKSVFGAVEEGESVTYSIDTDLDATKVLLYIKGKEDVIKELSKKEADGKATWSADVALSTYGQYKYFFAIYYGSYVKVYCDDDGNYGTGILTDLTSTKPYDLTVYKKGYKTPDWMKNAVIYQIFPDRFYNGDTSNDDAQTTSRGATDYEFITDWSTLPENPDQEKANADSYPSTAYKGDGNWSNEIYGGDLQGIIKRIDYLKALGVNVIYLNPVFSSISTHRYDTSDYSKIDPILGDLGDFTELVKVAKENDMHIVLDGVFNHVSDDSVYFDRYYKFVGKDGKVGAYPYWAYVYDYMNDNKDATQEQAVKAAKEHFTELGVNDFSYTEWFTVNNTALIDKDTKEAVKDTIGERTGKEVYGYEGWWGYDSMPVITSTNGSEYQTGNWGTEVIEGEKSIGQYWLNQGSNGWRLDVANEVSDETWQHFRESVKSLNEDNVVIGEIWDDATEYLLGDMYDSVMNYIFRNAVCAFAKGGAASDSLMALENIRERYPKEAFYAMMNLVGSHDTTRLLSYLDGISDDRTSDNSDSTYPTVGSAYPTYETTSNTAKMRQYIVAFIQMTYAGAPTIYYGDEIGMVGADDPDDRRAMTWGEGNKELVEWYAKLAKIRSEYTALRTGEVAPFDVKDSDNKVIESLMGYVRSDDKNQMIVISNNSENEKEVTIEVKDLIKMTAGTLFDQVSGAEYTVKDGKATITIPAYRGVILTENKKSISIDAEALKPAYDPSYKVGSSLTEVTVNKTSATINKGNTLSLSITYAPSNAADIKEILWTSSNEAVATVKDGVVTGVGAGKATITVTLNEVVSATYEITVKGEVQPATPSPSPAVPTA